jgi:hypothetical protein
MSPDISRRRFMQATAGAATVGAVSTSAPPRYSPVGRAQAQVVAAGIGIAVGAAALGYVAGRIDDHEGGDDRDYSNYTGADALRTEVEEGGLSMRSADERVMTTISNNVENLDNILLAKGKAATVETMNAGGTESEAQTAMQDAIDEHTKTVQKNLLTHLSEQVLQLKHLAARTDEHADISHSRIYNYIPGSSTATYQSFIFDSEVTATYELVDGTLHEFQTGYINDHYGNWSTASGELTPDYGAGESTHDGLFYVLDDAEPDKQEGGSTGMKKVLDIPEIRQLMNDLVAKRDDVNSQLSGFVSDVYSAYEPGEIPTEDLVDPITASTELRQNYDHYATQGAHAAMMGIPTSAEQSVRMELLNDEVTVWADIFTEHVPTDSNGNEVGFEADTTYSPSGWDKPLYISYEMETEDGEIVADFTQIEQDFTITAIENSDGEAVDSFQTTSRNNQTADVESLREELAQIREAQLAMQEEAQDGGGGSSGFDVSNLDFAGIPGEAIIVGLLTAIGGTVAYAVSKDER